MAPWIIDFERREIRDASGGHAGLRRRQFDVLLYLAQRHDEVVSKDELIRVNWHGLAVGDDSLTKCISEIRRVLGPGLRGSLRTLTGRGYMLTGWRMTDGRRLVPSPEEAGRLPAARPLVGREADTNRVLDLLTHERLVTIAGSGGVGKTSLAIAAAHRAAAGFSEGAYFVPLAPLGRDGSVAAAILARLRISTDGDPLSAIVAELRNRRLLLVLDNCEHVIDDAALVVTKLLAEAPGVVVLATSREPLAVDLEAICRVGPLAYPAKVTGIAASEALRYPAVQLLARRAALVDQDFVLRNEDDVEAAIELCRRLDGIPLAIVLASTQMQAMRLDQVVQGLDQRFDLLVRGSLDADPKQRTLRAMVAWSVDLLSVQEQELFAQIGVFAGPAAADDIVAVCRIGTIAPPVAQIVSLVDKSLLNAHAAGTGPNRYGYHETTRAYALERMNGDRGVRRRHAERMVSVLEQAETELEVSPSAAWSDRYAPYVNDLRSALAWSLSAGGEPALAAALVARGAVLLDELSLLAERRSWVERALSLPEAAHDPAILGRLTLWRAMRTSWVVWDDGLAYEAATLFAQSGETLWEGLARAMAAASDGYVGEWDKAMAGFAAAEELLRPFGPTRSLSKVLRYRATILIWQKRTQEAVLPLEEATRIAEAIGYFTGAARARSTQGELAFEEGNMALAISNTLDDLAAMTEANCLPEMQMSLLFLAGYRLVDGQADAAVQPLLQGFEIDRRLGDIWAARARVELAATYLAMAGDLAGAAALMAYVKAANVDAERQGERFQEVLRMRVSCLLEPLAPELRNQAQGEGASWSLDEAIATAVGKLASR